MITWLVKKGPHALWVVLSALQRFSLVFADLSENMPSRLTLENDDVNYTLYDLLPICDKLAIPLVYDFHYHRCKPDGSSVGEATQLDAATLAAPEE